MYVNLEFKFFIYKEIFLIYKITFLLFYFEFNFETPFDI
jgi:hypothetical protein